MTQLDPAEPIQPEPTPPPIAVDPTATPSQVAATVRAVIFLLSGLGLLSRFLTPEQLAFVRSDGFLTTLSGLAATGALGWAWLRTHRNQVIKVTLTKKLGDSSTAYVKGSG